MFEVAVALIVGVALAMYVVIGSHPDFNPPPSKTQSAETLRADQGDSTDGAMMTAGSASSSMPSQ